MQASCPGRFVEETSLHEKSGNGSGMQYVYDNILINAFAVFHMQPSSI